MNSTNEELIYIVEDDEGLREELASLLSLYGYRTAYAADFTKAAREALALNADLIVVDLHLVGTSGHAICRDVRAAGDMPILVLTSSDSEFDEVMSLQLGADDYLTKPYSPAVLLAHVGRLLQRASGGASPATSWNGLELDAARSTVRFGGQTAELSRNEVRILATLMRARGAIVSRNDLMYELWQSDEFIDDNTLTVNVNRLRKSLASIGAPDNYLRTHRGQGYSL